MAVTITPGTATLLRVRGERGSCGCCGQRIVRAYTVRTSDGRELPLGKRCATKATGYAFNEIELRARQAERKVVLAERRAVVIVEYPGLTSEQICDVISSDWAWKSDAWRKHAHNHSIRPTTR